MIINLISTNKELSNNKLAKTTEITVKAARVK